MILLNKMVGLQAAIEKYVHMSLTMTLYMCHNGNSIGIHLESLKLIQPVFAKFQEVNAFQHACSALFRAECNILLAVHINHFGNTINKAARRKNGN